MTVICCVKNCSSKRSQKDTQRHLFQFTPESHCGTWFEAIGSNLRQGQKSRKFLYVCDLHFDKSCFEKNDAIIKKDGISVVVPRKRLRLKKSVVPSIFDLSTLGNCPEPANNEASASHLAPLLCRQSLTSFDSQIASSNLSTLHDQGGFSQLRQQPLAFYDSDSTKSSWVPAISTHSPFQPEPLASLGNGSTSKSCMPRTCDDEYPQHTNESHGFTVSDLLQQWNSKPRNDDSGSWGVFPSQSGLLFMLVEGEGTVPITRTVFIQHDMTIQLMAYGRKAKFPIFTEKISCLQDLLTTLKSIQYLGVCVGSDDGSYCRNGFFIRKCTTRSNRCRNCQNARRRKKDRERKVTKRAKAKALRERIFKKTIKQKYKRCKAKAARYKKELENLREKCAQQKENVLKEVIKHMREHNILAVPTIRTRNRYIKNFQPGYGFDPELFAMLRRKSAAMTANDRRGIFSGVLDEIKLSEGVHYDVNSRIIRGFVDLGNYTPDKQKNARADQALVFLFQPFRGQWVQNIAAFLSKGYAPGTVLRHLIMKAVILLEKAGFSVDVVTSDEATWNRSM